MEKENSGMKKDQLELERLREETETLKSAQTVSKERILELNEKLMNLEKANSGMKQDQLELDRLRAETETLRNAEKVSQDRIQKLRSKLSSRALLEVENVKLRVQNAKLKAQISNVEEKLKKCDDANEIQNQEEKLT